LILRGAQLLVLCAALTIGVAAAEKPATPVRSGIDLQYVDRSVRPQDDFYRYVNGRWLDSVQIPADEERITPSAQLNDVIRTRLRELIEQAAHSPDASQRKLADFYASYLDEIAVQKLGLQPLARDLAAIDAIGDRARLCAAFNELGQIWVRAPFTTSVLNDPDRPSESETLRILKSDEHSPRWVRGSAPLRNQDAFYEAFDVRAGDPMYLPPEKRVTVW
jgi:predicted metalloendopeptidase